MPIICQSNEHSNGMVLTSSTSSKPLPELIVPDGRILLSKPERHSIGITFAHGPSDRRTKAASRSTTGDAAGQALSGGEALILKMRDGQWTYMSDFMDDNIIIESTVPSRL